MDMWSSSGDDAKVYMIHQNFLLKIVNIFSALPSTKVEEQVYIEVKVLEEQFLFSLVYGLSIMGVGPVGRVQITAWNI